MNEKEKARFGRLTEALAMSERYRHRHEEAWNEYQALYTGQDTGPTLGCDKRKVNLIFQTVETMVSAPLEQHSKIYAKPRKKEAIAAARLSERVLSLWEDNNRTSLQIEKAHRDAAIYGHGWLKSAWITTQSRRVEPDPVELRNMLADRDQLEQRLGVGVLSDRDVKEYLMDMTVQITENHPLTRRVSIWDIWVDSQAKDMDDRAWHAHRYQRPLADVQGDNWYNLRARKDAKPSRIDSNVEHGRMFNGGEVTGGLDTVEIIEIWDLHNERLYVADYNRLNADDLLYAGDYPYAVGQPFTPLEFYGLPDQLYGAGVVELIAPLQSELNDIRDEMTQARRSMKQKFAAYRGVLDEDGIAALQSDIDGDVVLVDPDLLEGRPLSEMLVPLAGRGVNAELYNQGSLIQSDIYSVTGIDEIQRGGVQGYRSATQVNAANTFTSARLARMIRNVHFARVDVARKEIGLAAQFMDQPEVLRIVGNDEDLMALPGAFSDGRSSLFPFNRKDIAGDYDIHLDVGSYTPDSREARMDRLQQALALAAQFPELDRNRAIKELFTELGFPDAKDWVSANPSPIAFNQPPGSGALSVGGGKPPGNGRAEMDPSTKGPQP